MITLQRYAYGSFTDRYQWDLTEDEVKDINDYLHRQLVHPEGVPDLTDEQIAEIWETRGYVPDAENEPKMECKMWSYAEDGRTYFASINDVVYDYLTETIWECDYDTIDYDTEDHSDEVERWTNR